MSFPWCIGGKRQSAIEQLRGLGLTGNLQLCLDPGDRASFPSVAAQSVLDRSGNGYDFFRGATSAIETSDPTYGGTPGRLSVKDVLTFDGGDFLTYDSANETWMTAIHKDNAQFTLICWALMTGVGAVSIACTGSNSTTHIGFIWNRISTGPALNFEVEKGGGGAALTITHTSTFLGSQWVMLSVSLDEAVGASGAFLGQNLDFATFTSTYTGPSAGAATGTLHLGSTQGGGGAFFPSGSKMGMFLAWNIALTQAQVTSIFQATRGRFAV